MASALAAPALAFASCVGEAGLYHRLSAVQRQSPGWNHLATLCASEFGCVHLGVSCFAGRYFQRTASLRSLRDAFGRFHTLTRALIVVAPHVTMPTITGEVMRHAVIALLVFCSPCFAAPIPKEKPAYYHATKVGDTLVYTVEDNIGVAESTIRVEAVEEKDGALHVTLKRTSKKSGRLAKKRPECPQRA
jgi:hypothetical protein